MTQTKTMVQTATVRPRGFKLNSSTRQWEPKTAVDFLTSFSDWITEKHCEREDELRWARRDVRRFTTAAQSAWDAECSLDESEELAWFCEAALKVAATEPAMIELEEIYCLARLGGDLAGNFDFNTQLTLSWWEKYLQSDPAWHHEDWQAAGLSVEHLKAVQSPLVRQALRITRE